MGNGGPWGQLRQQGVQIHLPRAAVLFLNVAVGGTGLRGPIASVAFSLGHFCPLGVVWRHAGLGVVRERYDHPAGCEWGQSVTPCHMTSKAAPSSREVMGVLA
jgi:hypothetical protein